MFLDNKFIKNKIFKKNKFKKSQKVKIMLKFQKNLVCIVFIKTFTSLNNN